MTGIFGILALLTVLAIGNVIATFCAIHYAKEAKEKASGARYLSSEARTRAKDAEFNSKVNQRYLLDIAGELRKINEDCAQKEKPLPKLYDVTFSYKTGLELRYTNVTEVKALGIDRIFLVKMADGSSARVPHEPGVLVEQSAQGSGKEDE